MVFKITNTLSFRLLTIVFRLSKQEVYDTKTYTSSKFLAIFNIKCLNILVKKLILTTVQEFDNQKLCTIF